MVRMPQLLSPKLKLSPKGKLSRRNRSASIDKAPATEKSMEKYSHSSTTFDVQLHKVDEDLFRCYWSLYAETMIVEGSLSLPAKEVVADYCGKRFKSTSWTVPKLLHSTAVRPDLKQDAKLERALHYAHQLLLEYAAEQRGGVVDDENDNNDQDDLGAAARAEVALIVLMQVHSHRITTIFGSSSTNSGSPNNSNTSGSSSSSSSNSSSAFGGGSGTFGISSGSQAFTLPNKKSVEKLLSSFHSRSTTTEPSTPGITKALFSEESYELLHLPAHLLDAFDAGDDRGQALARLQATVNMLYTARLQKNVATPDVLDFVADHPLPEPDMPNHKFVTWVTVGDMHRQIQASSFGDKYTASVLKVLYFIKYLPKSVPKSSAWVEVQNTVGREKSRLLVLWWSLHCTLQEAKGLGSHNNNNGSHPEAS